MSSDSSHLQFKELDHSGAGSLWRNRVVDNMLMLESSNNGDDFSTFVSGLTLKNDGSVGVGTVPVEKLQVDGTVFSSSGGFKFPDGTVQTTAAAGGGSSYWFLDGSGSGDSALIWSGNWGIPDRQLTSGSGCRDTDQPGCQLQYQVCVDHGRWRRLQLGVVPERDSLGGGRNYAGLGGTVGGGSYDTAQGQFSTVGGGYNNKAIGNNSTIPGGYENRAGGEGSVAMGVRAKAAHDGTIVLSATSTSDSVTTSAAGLMVLRADNGLYITSSGGVAASPIGHLIETSTGAFLSASGQWANATLQARAIAGPVEGSTLLQRLADLQVQSWRYDDGEAHENHIGPSAADFNEAFGCGDADGISAADQAGVALVAIQELMKENKMLRLRLDKLEARVRELENR